MAAHEQDKQQIAAVIERYRCGFAQMDVEELTAIWDQDYDHIIYIAQEVPQPVRGWPGVERYYKRRSPVRTSQDYDGERRVSGCFW